MLSNLLPKTECPLQERDANGGGGGGGREKNSEEVLEITDQ